MNEYYPHAGSATIGASVSPRDYGPDIASETGALADITTRIDMLTKGASETAGRLDNIRDRMFGPSPEAPTNGEAKRPTGGDAISRVQASLDRLEQTLSRIAQTAGVLSGL